MRRLRWFACLAALGLALPASAADKPKKVLLVTHSGGFIHDSVGLAEQILKDVGPKHGLDVTCYRLTNPADPNILRDLKLKPGAGEDQVRTGYSERFRARAGVPVEKENVGRVDAATLKNFDCVLFFTTGNPLTSEQVKDLVEWVKAGGAFAGTHCASDTLYGDTPYGELVGAYFINHPWTQKIKLKVEDPKFPGVGGFVGNPEIDDEIYQFRDSPYSREKLHVIASLENSSVDTSKPDVKRKDKDFGVAWCQQVGKGRSFYTSLGHRKEVWRDARFQDHLVSGMKWAMGQLEGDATPSAKLAGTK